MYSNEQVIDVYEQMLAMGDYYSSGRPVKVEPRLIANDIHAKLRIKDKYVGLDVGCGVGLLAIHLAEKCHKLYAVDAGEKIVQRFRNLCDEKGITNIEVCQSWASVLAFEDNTFDFVVAYGIVHYFPDEGTFNQVIKEFLRVCKSGGKIFLGDVPEEDARLEFENSPKSSEEKKILEDFSRNREEYTLLFKQHVKTKIEDNPLNLTRALIEETARGNYAICCRIDQPKEFVFSLTRKDYIIWSQN